MSRNRQSPLRKKLRELRDESRRTGKRRQKVLQRSIATSEFPALGQDPRFAFTPETMKLDFTPMEAITVGELRQRCAEAGTDFALLKMQQVETLAHTQIVYLLRQDLDAIGGKIAIADHLDDPWDFHEIPIPTNAPPPSQPPGEDFVGETDHETE